MKNKLQIIKKIISQYRFILNTRQKKNCIFVFGIIIIASLFESLGVSAILPLVQAMLTPEQLLEKSYILFWTHIFHINTTRELLLMVCIFVIAIYLLKNLVVLLSSMIQIKFKLGLQKELSVLMLESYLKRPYAFFVDVNSSELIRGISTDVYGVYGILENIFKLLTELLVSLFIAAYLIYSDWIMAFAILILAVVCFILIRLGFRGKMDKLGKKNRIINARINQYAYETAEGIKEILVMHREQFFLGKYSEACENRKHTELWYNFALITPERIIEAVCVCGMIGIIGIRIYFGLDVNTFIPKLAVIAVAAFRILPAVSRITGYINGITYYAPTLEASYNNIRAVYEYRDRLKWEEHFVENGKMLNFYNQIIIDHISFKYENTKKEVLSNLTLTIHKGESIGIIGLSGAGKTTFADIILGLLIPQKGKILVDDIDIHERPIEWSRLIGYVPQSVYLLDDTIRNNVLFGANIKAQDDKLVWRALEQAQLKKFVENLPDGLDTIVGEKGVKFSGGQRQRVVIARALYYDPQIVVLDEATSALDSETEDALMEAVDSLHNHKTLIIIAHRVSTLRNCDRIIEIRNGKAVDVRKEDIFEM